MYRHRILNKYKWITKYNAIFVIFPYFKCEVTSCCLYCLACVVSTTTEDKLTFLDLCGLRLCGLWKMPQNGDIKFSVVRPFHLWAGTRYRAPPLHHFRRTPGSRCCHQLLTAALVSEIFWLRFCTVRGSEDTLSIFINVTGLDCCPLDQTPVLMVRMCCNIWQKTSCRSAHLQPHPNLHKLQSMFDTIMILVTKSRCFFSGGAENSFFLLSSLPQQIC